MTRLDTLLHLGDHGVDHLQDANMDIGGSLRSLGLEQYEAAFRDNAISAGPAEPDGGGP